MPYSPPRPCNFLGCPKKQHAAYCDEHRKQRTREYEQSRRGHNRAYWSAPWKRARAAALKRDNYVCTECLKDDRVTPATTIHHLVKFDKDNWQTDPLFTDLNNLTSLCFACHNRIDGGYGGSKQTLKDTDKKTKPVGYLTFEERFGNN